jgi:hypothetical protein
MHAPSIPRYKTPEARSDIAVGSAPVTNFSMQKKGVSE